METMKPKERPEAYILYGDDYSHLITIKNRCYRHFGTHEKLSSEDIYDIGKLLDMVLSNCDPYLEN